MSLLVMYPLDIIMPAPHLLTPSCHNYPLQTFAFMGSPVHLDVAHLHQSLPPPLSVAPLGLPHRLCLGHASREASTSVALITSSGTYWRHHGFLIRLPPLNPVSCAQTSNIGLKVTHCAPHPIPVVDVCGLCLHSSCSWHPSGHQCHSRTVGASLHPIPHYLP